MKYIRPLLLILIALALACGQNSSDPGTIQWWQFWTSPDVKPTIKKLAADFETRNPDLKVEIGDLTWSDGHEKIVIALAAGKGPDVLELGSDWIAEFAANGKLVDLTKDVAPITDHLTFWEPARLEGKVYAVPWLLGTRVLYCNRTLLTKAGYKANWTPQNLSHLVQAAGKINDLGEDIYGFGSNSAERHRLYKKFLPFFWTCGGNIFHPGGRQTAFASREGVRALGTYLRLSQSGVIESQARLEDYFAEGKIGFVISGDWLLKRLLDDDNDVEFFVSTFPGLRTGQIGTSFAGGEYLAINAASDKKDQALKLIKHLVTSANSQAFAQAVGSFTAANVRANSITDSNLVDVANVFQLQMSYSRSTPTYPGWVYIEEALEKGLESALYDKVTPREALLAVDRDCILILEKHGVYKQ